ncbi:hypothetical protein PILCRDRAFT_192230 [Piloderma croceum F 1598]|uniref:Uncharacterized protein n=1 Tax=Piloderma croceum (strain F 1598) TaxID=765440 RepID=A0A0C3GD75_PILCF|nr:hypothetical protein PILCRDRAFT_192230 [Piloderma croceum F 1598]
MDFWSFKFERTPGKEIRMDQNLTVWLVRSVKGKKICRWTIFPFSFYALVVLYPFPRDLIPHIHRDHTSLAVFLPTAVSACPRLFSCFAHSEYHSATTFWIFTLVSDILLNIHYFNFA